ncbi:NUDIX hydrolase [Rhodohalobacter sp. 8-1]|uniref:NUDIX hydrolase n=1 Tax=Rhodohalobacter sp. 8-1 TaxID=3131972 RepID=UPI0030EC7D2A
MINPDAVQIKAAGGLVIRFIKDSDTHEALLIFRNGVWDLPKGKLEKGESIPECATREVSEEIGLSSRADILADLGSTRHTYTLKGQPVEKETFWFLMHLAETVENFKPQKAEGITDVKWVPVKKAMEKVGFQNLEAVIRRFINNRDNLGVIDI